MYAMSAAHPTLPIPCYVRVTNVANGKSVIVRVNDRGPFHSERIMDLSYTAAFKLGYANHGSALVEIERILPAEMALQKSNAATETKPDAPPPAPAPAPATPETTVAAVTNIAPGFYLQLGAFSARENAESFRTRIIQ